MSSADIAARLACQDLMIQSYRLVDNGRASGATELFTEDGRFAIAGSVDINGKESLTRFFSTREDDTERKTRHCLTNLAFSSSSAGEASIRATLILFVLSGSDPTTPNALADVEDTYRMEGGRWRIAARTTTLVAGGA
jgi:hypothetical protein